MVVEVGLAYSERDEASSVATGPDARYLAWVRDQLGDRITALPISAIWAAR